MMVISQQYLWSYYTLTYTWPKNKKKCDHLCAYNQTIKVIWKANIVEFLDEIFSLNMSLNFN